MGSMIGICCCLLTVVSIVLGGLSYLKLTDLNNYIRQNKPVPQKDISDRGSRPDGGSRPGQPLGDNNDKNISMPWWGWIIVLIFVGIVIFGIYFSYKMTLLRYQIASDAVKHGDSVTAAEALSPEIGEAFSTIIRGNPTPPTH